MQLLIDRNRARLVIRRLHEDFAQRRGLLSELDDLVENQIPDGVSLLSLEHACFLFYMVPNDHGVKSRHLYSRAKQFFVSRPEMFSPVEMLRSFSGPDDRTLSSLLAATLGVRYPNEAARSWYLNSARIVTEYGGDPRQLFQSTQNAPELLRRILSFRSYGPKTGGMLLRAIGGLGFASLTDLEDVLLPVDVHDSRISFMTRIVRLPAGHPDPDKGYYPYVPQVQKALLDACNSLGMSWPDIDRALWIIGSRGCVSLRCTECPLLDMCEVGVGERRRNALASKGALAAQAA